MMVWGRVFLWGAGPGPPAPKPNNPPPPPRGALVHWGGRHSVRAFHLRSGGGGAGGGSWFALPPALRCAPAKTAPRGPCALCPLSPRHRHRRWSGLAKVLAFAGNATSAASVATAIAIVDSTMSGPFTDPLSDPALDDLQMSITTLQLLATARAPPSSGLRTGARRSWAKARWRWSGKYEDGRTPSEEGVTPTPLQTKVTVLVTRLFGSPLPPL